LANGKDFPRSYHFDADKHVFGGDVLFAIKGSLWSFHRRLLNPFFSTSKQKSIFTIVQAVTMKATRILDEHCDSCQVLDLKSLVSKLTCDVICSYVFGKDFGCLDGDEHGVNAFYSTCQREVALANQIPFYAYLPLPNRIAFWMQRRKFYRFVSSAILAAPEDSMAGALLRGGQLSMPALCAEIVGLIFAGHDTTASVVTFCLGRYLPAAPAALASLRAAADLLPPDVADWTPAAVRGDEIEAVVSETLRLVPPGAAHPVQPAADARAGGHLLRRGAPVLANYHAMFRDPALFGPDADAFRPSRWRDGTVERAAAAAGLRASAVFAPFLTASPHACLGRPVAELEAALVVLAWARRFTLAPHGPPAREAFGVTIAPSHMRVRVERRAG
jgi:cytochrome P450